MDLRCAHLKDSLLARLEDSVRVPTGAVHEELRQANNLAPASHAHEDWRAADAGKKKQLPLPPRGTKELPPVLVRLKGYYRKLACKWYLLHFPRSVTRAHEDAGLPGRTALEALERHLLRTNRWNATTLTAVEQAIDLILDSCPIEH